MGKILIYALTEGKGGVEEYVMNLSRFTCDPSTKYGYLILGESSIYEDELNGRGIEYFYIPPKSKILSNIQAYEHLFRNLRSNYDTIYFNTSGLYYPVPYLIAKKYNYKIALHSHSSSGPWYKSFLHKFNRRWINRVTQIKLACSTPAGEWMFGGNEKFTLIPNAIELERFVFQEVLRKDCRVKYGLNDSFVIGNVGRLHKIKNQVFLVEILKALLERGCNVKLLLVGDGEMKSAIADEAQKMDVLDRVVFAGHTNHPEWFYSGMDCLVMPSFTEGFPITLIEAQANGLPCVVSDTITRETNISGKIRFTSLKDPVEKWCDEIQNNTERYDCMEYLNEKGFDVSQLDERISAIIAL